MSKHYRSSEILINESTTVALIEPAQGTNYVESLDILITFSPNRIAEDNRPFLILIEGATENG